VLRAFVVKGFGPGLLAIVMGVVAGGAMARHLTERQVHALEAGCEKAREAKLAPLREQAIKDCIAQPRSDPALCREHFKDFGAARRLASGAVNPRMFHNIPECAAAEEARQHFGLYPQ
jgi:hypothetical protein